MAAWRIIDLTQFSGSVSSKTGAIVLHPEDKPQVVLPVADVAVVLIGMGVKLSGAVLHRLTAADVCVLLCDWRGIPEAGAFAWRPHSRVAARRVAQAGMSVPKQKTAWKAVVRRKIENQAKTLLLCGKGKDSKKLVELESLVRSGDPDNIEGRAARYYWSALFGKEFSRQPGLGDGVNSMLDYGYTIVRGHGVRAVLAAGLEPSLGIFHHNRANLFCLVDDLMEIFRPLVDLEVFRLTKAGKSSAADCKAELVAAASSQYRDDGIGIPAAFEDLAQLFGRYVESQVKSFSPPKWFK